MKTSATIPILLGLLLPAALLAARPDTTSSASLIRAMHERYAEAPPVGVTLVRRVVRLAADGGVDTTHLREASLPGLRRVEFDRHAGDGLILRDGLRFEFEGGELVGARPQTNPFLLLLNDVHAQPPERTAHLLDSLGFDLSTIGEDRWEGAPVWVIGEPDIAAIWIEKERLLPLRVVQPLASGGLFDVRIPSWTARGQGWVESRIEIYVDGALVQSEDTVELATHVALPESVFDPLEWEAGAPGGTVVTGADR